jgi:hypothetical protein
MDATGKYIYGVIDGGQGERFPLDGVVRFATGLGQAIETPPCNVDCEQAYTISWQDISAVVGDAPVVDYLAMPKGDLARLLVRHQQVIERVMAQHTILPFRLGTVVESDEQVRQILAKGSKTITEALQKAQGVVEIDVTATIGDFHLFLLQVSQAAEIGQLKQALLQMHGRVTVEDQMKVGMLLERHAGEQKQEMSKEIHAALNYLAEDFKAHDLMDDKMVLNSAFLVRKDRQGEFDNQVEQLNLGFDDTLNFRCVGPLPPYSFYTLEARVTDFEEVAWARRQLGLSGDFITVDAIKKAHRRLALTCHPDKNPGVPDIEQKFADMSRAYKLLLDYSQAFGRTEEPGGLCLDEEAIEKNAILVTTLG